MKVTKDILLKLMFISESLHNLHNYLPYLPEGMKIEQIEKLVANLHNKTEYVIHIRNLKQALYYGLVLKKVHRITKFNLKALLNNMFI